MGAPEVGREHRQVVDLPPISPRVIEHSVHFFEALTTLAEDRTWLPETA